MVLTLRMPTSQSKRSSTLHGVVVEDSRLEEGKPRLQDSSTYNAEG